MESSIQPRADVTIVRDKATGVPHITGTTRDGTMFGAGFAGANDRLFLMDCCAGSAAAGSPHLPGARRVTRRWSRVSGVIRLTPKPICRLRWTRCGSRAHAEPWSTATSRNNPRRERLHRALHGCPPGHLPRWYVLNGHLDPMTNAGGPEPFTITDIVAISGVVGGRSGGGGEPRWALPWCASRLR